MPQTQSVRSLHAMHARCHERPASVAAADAEAEPMRCVCGALIARLVAGGVELKCRRCKRTVLVALTEEENAAE